MTHVQFKGGNMNFVPTNRHLVVKPIIQEVKEDPEVTIVLPTNYSKPESPYLLCKVVEVAADSKFHKSIQDEEEIVVERRMLNKIEIDEEEFYLILENYVFGRIKREIN